MASLDNWLFFGSDHESIAVQSDQDVQTGAVAVSDASTHPPVQNAEFL